VLLGLTGTWRQILSFCDGEIISNLMYEMRSKGARFLLGETIKSVEVTTLTTFTGTHGADA
jgi:hypothetical protein